MKEISITGDFIKLDALLKFASLLSSGGEAKVRIENGEVTVNGTVCEKRGTKVRRGDQVSMDGNEITIV